MIRSVSLPQLAIFLVLVLAAWDVAEAESIAPSVAKEIVSETTPGVCGNIIGDKEQNPECCPNEATTCPMPLEGSSAGGASDGPSFLSFGSSVIDNNTFNYHHLTQDYQPAAAKSAFDSSCSSCTSSPDSGPSLLKLAIERRHRYRNVMEESSFGPGVYGNYDSKIRIDKFEGGLQMSTFSPQSFNSLRLVDGIDGDGVTPDGVFTDQRNQALAGARMLDAQGQLTGDLDLAKEVTIEAHEGLVHHFELIDLSAGPAAVSTNGLVAQYSFDEGSGATVADGSGNGNDAVVNGSPTWVTGRTGNVSDSALQFSATNHFVQASNSSELEVGKNGADYAVAFWIKLQQASDGKWRNIMRKGAENSERSPAIWLHPNGNKLYCRCSTTHHHDEGLTSTNALVLNEWTHVAMVVNNGKLMLYLNGRLDNQAQLVGSTISSDGPLYVGRDQFFQGPFCQVDDFRLYNRNLFEAEVKALSASKDVAGRLTKIRDRNDYCVNLSYRYNLSDPDPQIQSEIASSPTRQWQIDTVTDPQGRAATFHYAPSQVSGRWVVNQIDLPNGESIDYLYEDGMRLTKVEFPDQTVSTIEYADDPQTQTFDVTWDDVSAEGTHRKKTASLTHNIFIGSPNLLSYELFNQGCMTGFVGKIGLGSN